MAEISKVLEQEVRMVRRLSTTASSITIQSVEARIVVVVTLVTAVLRCRSGSSRWLELLTPLYSLCHGLPRGRGGDTLRASLEHFIRDCSTAPLHVLA